jgi:hypothetical protein
MVIGYNDKSMTTFTKVIIRACEEIQTGEEEGVVPGPVPVSGLVGAEAEHVDIYLQETCRG